MHPLTTLSGVEGSRRLWSNPGRSRRLGRALVPWAYWTETVRSVFQMMSTLSPTLT
jgi:hypothetical protein